MEDRNGQGLNSWRPMQYAQGLGGVFVSRVDVRWLDQLLLATQWRVRAGVCCKNAPWRNHPVRCSTGGILQMEGASAFETRNEGLKALVAWSGKRLFEILQTGSLSEPRREIRTAAWSVDHKNCDKPEA